MDTEKGLLSPVIKDAQDMDIPALAKAIADLVANEVEALYTNGPAGGCGAVKRTRDIVSVASILVDRNDVIPTVTVYEV